MNFKFEKVHLATKADFGKAVEQRRETHIDDARVPGAPPVSIQDSFSGGNLGAVIEALMALKDNAGAWVEKKAVGDATDSKPENVGSAIWHQDSDPTLIRRSTPVAGKPADAAKTIESGMGSAERWHPVIQEARVIREFPLTALEAEKGLSQLRLTHVKLNNVGMLGAMGGARDMAVLEIQFGLRGREIDGFAYVNIERAVGVPDPEGTRVGAGYACMWAESGKVGYIGTSQGATGWTER